MNRWDMLLKLAKALLAALLVVMLAAMIHGSTWKADFEELEERVETGLNLSGMQKGDEQLLRRLYGLNAGELKHWVLYTIIWMWRSCSLWRLRRKGRWS